MSLTLTQDQQHAQQQILDFIFASPEKCFVLAGHAGTGKTTLMNYVEETYQKKFELNKLIDPKLRMRPFLYTATTNKAAEALENATGKDTTTIHSLLGIRVGVDTKTGENYLYRPKTAEPVTDAIIVVDESSYIDHLLLKYITENIEDAKIIFMGDPAQLTPVNSSKVPVFTAGYPEARLKEVVRQDKDSPIQQICKDFRAHILDGEKFPKVIRSSDIQHMDRDTFNKEIVKEFTRPDWNYNDSKILAWRNKTVVKFNQMLFKKNTGRKEFASGDYVINNHYVKSGTVSIATDESVCIQAIKTSEQFGCEGYSVRIKDAKFFQPKNPKDYDKFLQKAVDEGNANQVFNIKNNWIDLRPMYACTVNKSQGSTYNKVYIDLTDLGYCRDRDLLARMLYVAISRARTQVIFVGDL